MLFTKYILKATKIYIMPIKIFEKIQRHLLMVRLNFSFIK